MKKPRNFDKIDKIKFSEIHKLISPIADPSLQYNKNKDILDTSNITIYDVTPVGTLQEKYLYANISKILIVHTDNKYSDRVVMDIHWDITRIRATIIKDTNTKPLHITPENVVSDKNFKQYQAQNVYQFIQVCIYPICIEMYYNLKWNPQID